MTAATLSEVLGRAAAERRAVAGLVVLGWEDARAYVEAAEEAGVPVILQAGPGCRRHTPTPMLGKMFRTLADAASVPVVCHIDHATTMEECRPGHRSRLHLGDDRRLEAGAGRQHRAHRARRRGGASRRRSAWKARSASSVTSAARPRSATAPRGRRAAGARERDWTRSRSRSATSIWPRRRRRRSTLPRSPPSPPSQPGPAGAARRQRHSGRDARAGWRADYRVAKFNIGTELRMAFGAALRAHLDGESAKLRPQRNPVGDGARAQARRAGGSRRALASLRRRGRSVAAFDDRAGEHRRARPHLERLQPVPA